MRPTTDRVREALFSMLGSRISFAGEPVWDLFAGTGALGLEALSRGASHATFVEAHGPTLGLAKRNAKTLDVQDQASFVKSDALRFLQREPLAQRPRVIFADPPYDLEALAELPSLALPHLAPEALFVLEHDGRHDFADHPETVVVRDYGSTRLTLFERAAL